MEQHPEPRERRQAAIAADKARAEQKPAPRTANGAVKEKKRSKADEEFEEFERKVEQDNGEREVVILETREPADQRIYTSIVVKATQRSKPIKIDNIRPFCFKQKTDSAGMPPNQVWPDASGAQSLQQVLGPVKKRVKKISWSLIKEMSGISDDSSLEKTGRRKRAATLPATLTTGPKVNSITGGLQHDFTTADSNDAFRERFYAADSYVKGEAFVNISRARSLGQNYGSPSLQLRREAAAAERERQAREETLSAGEGISGVADDQETVSESSLSPDIESSERRMALSRAPADFGELEGQFEAFQEKLSDERRKVGETSGGYAEGE